MEQGGQGGASCQGGEDRGEERELGSPAASDFEQDGGGSVEIHRAILPQSDDERGREKRRWMRGPGLYRGGLCVGGGRV
jgi:hypothetical protein